MKKYLLKSSLLAALALWSTSVAWADNLVYGFLSGHDASWNSYLQKVSLNLDSLNKGTIKTENIGESFTDLSSVNVGVCAGDKYFAFANVKDAEDPCFVSVNFTTGKVVVINNFSYAWSKPGHNVSGLTYDEVNKKLYAIEKISDDNNNTFSKLYEVSQADGSLSEVAQLDTVYTSIASDHKGGLYLTKDLKKGWWPYPQLVKLNADMKTTTQVAANTVMSASSSSNTLLASEDGKTVYLFFGQNVLAYDLESKSCSKLIERGDVALSGLTYGLSSADGEAAEKPYEPVKQTRFLVAEYTYGGVRSSGDNFGVQSLAASEPSELDSRRVNYYYNPDGKLVSSLGLVRNYKNTTTFDTTFNNESLVRNYYDENGNVAKSSSEQWGNYNFENWCWKPTAANSATYTYDENNRIATAVGVDTHFYTYNEFGEMVKDSVASTLTKQRQYVYTYNYEEHQLVSYSYEGNYEAYTCYVDYDEDGKKVGEEKWSAATEQDPEGEGYSKFVLNPDGTRKMVRTQVQEYLYDDSNNLVASNVYSIDATGENQTLVEKLRYTNVKNGDFDEVFVTDSSIMNNMWCEAYPPKRYVYQEMSSVKADQFAFEVMAAANEDELNTVDLAWTMPRIADTRLPKFVIYRDAAPIDTVDALDIIDSESGLCIYQDKRLMNGTYTYFVQPIFAVSTGGGVEPFDISVEPGFPSIDPDAPAVDPEEPAEETQYDSYYCSNPVTVELNTKIPAVEDFKLVGAEDVKSGTSFNRTHKYYGIFNWKNPADYEKYGLISHKVYFAGTSVPQDTYKQSADSISVQFYDDEKVCLVSHYELGYACSDTIDVDYKYLSKELTGVEIVSVDGAVKATFSASVITLSDAANVAVFAANGQQIYAEENTTSVSLANLPASTYVVLVEKDGKVNAYKFSKK